MSSARRIQRSSSVGIEFPQPVIADPEVVRDLVSHGAGHLCADAILIVSGDRHDRGSVERDRVGQDVAVPMTALRERDPVIQAQEVPLIRRREILDEDLDVRHRVEDPGGETVDGLGRQFLEAFAGHGFGHGR